MWSYGAAVSPDGTRIVASGVVASTGQTVGKVRWSGGDEVWHPIPVPRGNVMGVAFDPAGERVAVGLSLRSRRGDGYHWRSYLCVCRLDPVEIGKPFVVYPAPIVVAFDRTGTRVACTGGIDGEPEVVVHDAATGELAFEFKPKGTQSRGLSFDAAGRLAVVNAKWVYVLPPDGGKPQFVLEATKQMNAGVFSPDGRRILTGDHAGALRVWDSADGSPVKSFDWQIGPVTAVAFAPDGLTCAAAGTNGRVVLWDVDE